MKFSLFSELANSPRLQYAVKVFNSVLQKSFFELLPLEKFSTRKSPYFVYTATPEQKNCSLRASPLLKTGFYEKITPENFPEIIGEDPFALAFFLLSEYESRYLPLDKHQRPDTRYSLRNNIDNFQTPLLLSSFGNFLQKISEQQHFRIPFPRRKNSLTISIDIDHIGYFLYRPFYKTLLSLSKKLFFGDFAALKAHSKALLKKQDPLDKVFEKLSTSSRKIRLFFLLSSHSSYDSRTPYPHKQWKKIASKFPVENTGIHLSYYALQKNKQAHKEIRNYEALYRQKPMRNRFHYLRKQPLQSYQKLIELGIKEDFTSLPLHTVGFLHGITFPFFWYDLEKEQETSLKIVPTLAMDRTVKDTMRKSPRGALAVYSRLLEEFSKWGGEADLLFHPESLAGIGEWQGWHKVTEAIFEKMKF